VVGNEETAELVTYGDIPEYKGSFSKEYSGNVFYEFTGWDSQIKAVDGNITYTAQFEEKFIIPFASGGGASIDYGDGVIVADCTQNGTNPIKIDVISAIAESEFAICIKAMQGEITFGFLDTIALCESGAEYIDLSTLKKSDGGYQYKITLLDYEGKEISNEIFASVTLPFTVTDLLHTVLSYATEEGRVPVDFTVDESSVSFKMGLGRLYTTKPEYTAKGVSSGAVKVGVLETDLKPGDSVTIDMTVPNGVEVVSLYYISEAGERVEISGNSFVMPAGSVELGVEYEYIKYNVSFVSDGKVIASYVCIYGEEVKIPPTPKKAPDTKYSYTFKGWSSEVVPVTEDFVYTALFYAEKLPDKVQDGPQITEPVMKIIVLGATLASTLVFLVIPSSVLSIVLSVKRKRRFIKAKKK